MLCPVPGVLGITLTLFLETVTEMEEPLPVRLSFPPGTQIEVRQEVGRWPSQWIEPRLGGADEGSMCNVLTHRRGQHPRPGGKTGPAPPY